MQNTLEGMISRLNDTEEQISEWPGRQSSENHPNWTEKENNNVFRKLGYFKGLLGQHQAN